jgi:hypothetical protein
MGVLTGPAEDVMRRVRPFRCGRKDCWWCGGASSGPHCVYGAAGACGLVDRVLAGAKSTTSADEDAEFSELVEVSY